MKLQNKKSLISIIVLFIYIIISIFSLISFVHTNEMPMEHCPYAQGGYTVCKTNFEHINSWYQFSNIILPTIFILITLILFAVLFLNKKFLFNELSFFRWNFCLEKKYLNLKQEKITKWLSLFENSPSFNAHSFIY